MQLETDRLILRPPNKFDAGPMAEFLTRNRDHFGAWESDRSDDFFTVESQLLLMLRAVQGWNSGTRYLFLIDRKPDNALIGTIHFSNVLRGNFQSCRVGYKLDQAHSGNGYMTEAMRAAMDFVFDQGLRTIVAYVLPTNDPSRRVLDKLGFRRDGIERKYMKIDGVHRDHIRMVRARD